MRPLIAFLRDYRGPYALLLLVLAGAAFIEALALASLYPLLSAVLGAGEVEAGPILGAVGDVVRVFPEEQRLTGALAIFVGVMLASSLAKLLRDWMQAYVTGLATLDVKRRVFDRLRTAPYASFLQRHHGDLAYRLSLAPQNLALALLIVAQVSSFTLTGLTTFLVLLSIEWRVTLAMLVLGAMFFRVNRYVAGRFSWNAGREKLAAQSAELGVATDFVTGAKEIGVAGAGHAWMRRFLLYSEVYRRYYVRDLGWSAIPGQLLELMVFVTAGIAAVVLRLAAPDMILALLPVLAVYVYAARQLLGTLGLISRQLLRIASLGPDVALLRAAVIESFPRVQEGSRIDIDGWRAINMSDVSFTYPGRSDAVLRDVGFTIERGKTTALVGESGVGKTTLFYLLLRLFEPDRGRIAIDDVDLAEFDRERWLARVGYVGQEHFIFSGTIEENIAFGEARPAAAIEAAARAAHADEFIAKLPGGYDEVIGDRGMTLSAGQRQRLLIARALLREPTLLLLDEATSALDGISEQLIQRALAEIAERCTMVVVAHRLSTVRRADQIIVLDRGSVVESGRHEQLIAAGGVYARLAGSFEDPARAAV